ncbi:Gfo/Idh/MocA family protein [Desulfopila sp. IMCC35008]|uniref:Gfo/Idh/MocA family protein n=1 Tax=Desulfopila sp. IMCC35008 TaxID=2653858 RepID=UPI0013D255E3|nr:Gfo/Idh/MocA family oxidoreductase [Desulfopila sp. IMCC35008]
MRRIGIIGTGKHGSRYANHVVNDLAGAKLAGISRRSPDGIEQAKVWGCNYFKDWQALIADPQVDALIAVTPPGLNLEIAQLCAAHSKPLLIEKPLARDSREASALVSTMESANCPLTVGQTLRYNPVIAALGERLPEMGRLHSFAVDQRIEPSTLAWHDDPEAAGAGVMMHTAVHVFDALKVITGLRILRVMATMKCVHSSRLEDLVVMLVECENNVFGTVDVSKVGHARSGRFEFICQKGQLVGEQIHGFLEIVEQNRVTDHRDFEPFPTILPLLTDWLAFLDGSGENPICSREGLYAVQVCSAALQSAEAGEWVEV